MADHVNGIENLYEEYDLSVSITDANDRIIVEGTKSTHVDEMKWDRIS